MYKLCLVLTVSSTFFCESTESVIDGDQAVVAAHNAASVLRLEDTTADSPRPLRSHSSAVGMTASAAHRSLKSNGAKVYWSDRRGENEEERMTSASTLADGLERLSKVFCDLWTDRFWVLDQQLEMWSQQKLHPDEAAKEIGLDGKHVSAAKLENWMEYVRLYMESNSNYDLDKAYQVLRGDLFEDKLVQDRRHSEDKVFERLTSLRDVDDERLILQIAWMYNKLAGELKSKSDVEASSWMATKWKALKLPPKKVAVMLGIRQAESLSELEHSATQWLHYVQLLKKQKSVLALSDQEAERLLFGNKKAQEVERFLLNIEDPDLKSLVNEMIKIRKPKETR